MSQNLNDEKMISHTDEKIISYNYVDKEAVVAEMFDAQSEPSRPIEERKIFELRRKMFFILLTVILFLIKASAVDDDVGDTNRKDQTTTVPIENSTPTLPQAPTSTQARYANTSLAVMQ